ncbi:hypothetical protein B0H12DRAFT_1116469 [Mycena haematopus]|nr:hypothetical protein B0H12DRAFT_1116469 [Mycena haematopus]
MSKARVSFLLEPWLAPFWLVALPKGLLSCFTIRLTLPFDCGAVLCGRTFHFLLCSVSGLMLQPFWTLFPFLSLPFSFLHARLGLQLRYSRTSLAL